MIQLGIFSSSGKNTCVFKEIKLRHTKQEIQLEKNVLCLFKLFAGRHGQNSTTDKYQGSAIVIGYIDTYKKHQETSQ